MPDLWNSIKNTAKSMGGVAYAPAGAVVDLAQMPFDDKDDDFGSVVSALANRGGDLLDPVTNPQTLTGSALSKSLAGMNWLWREGISEPVATANMVNRHTFGGFGNAGPIGWLAATATGQAHWGDVFDAETWSKAYEQANSSENPLGTAFAYGALNPLSDPLAEDDVEESLRREHGTWGTGLALTGEIAGSFVGDPTWAALKGVGAVRGVAQYGKLTAVQRGNMLDEITAGSKSGVLRPNLESRTDKYLDWIGGKNSISRPLTGPEILHGTPELKRYAAEPHVIAGLLADANTITNFAERRNAQRRILAVAAGDVSQISRLRTESSETAALADELTNMVSQSSINLKALGAAPTLRTDPRFMAALETQLTNLNSRGDIDRFFDDWNARIDHLLQTQHTMPRLPGVHLEGRRAVNRVNDRGVARAPRDATRALDSWGAKRAAEASSASSVFQRGLHTVPIVAVKTVGLAASPWTKVPVAVSDSLRQTSYTGIANLHDWGGSTTQLDSMMQVAKVSPGDRMKLLSEAYLAKNEPEKMRAIERVEHASMTALARWASDRSGRTISTDYLTKLMEEGAAKRGVSLASMRGRAYAATEMPPGMAARVQSAARTQDTVRATESTGWNANATGKWRLDQINDDGTPLALPVLESQLANSVPLVDIDLAKRAISRDTGHLSRLSRAWEAESKELGRLAGLKAAGHTGLDRAIAARSATLDWLVQAGDKAMRVWKFSVLFRLGYPLRVLTDDHLRIWSTMGAASFYGPNAKEFAANLKFNVLDRRAEGRLALHEAKVRRREILDELDGDVMALHVDRQSDLKSAEASLRAHRRTVTKMTTRIEQAETKRSLGLDHEDLTMLRDKLATAKQGIADREAARTYLLDQLGDYGPDDLKRELESLDELIAAGAKPMRPDKRGVGSNDIHVDGVSYPGAFGDEFGSIMRAASSSGGTYDHLLQGAEERTYRSAANGTHRTIRGDEPGHATAWADVLNNQFRTSPAAMHFINGGTVDEFVKWLRNPEQAELRRRLSHFAHDPEDWGQRISGIVHDYIPTEALRQAVIKGRVSTSRLEKMFTDPATRPAVHGRSVADNLGTSAGSLGIGRAMNRVYRVIGELPTDHLSRHPYFNSMYRLHVQEISATKRAGGAGRFTPDDIAQIARTARKLALKDVKSTLFDLSAHSHAAHVMRFISPFFGAHQEGVARWWRIAADNPAIIRRFTQVMDIPRVLAIEVDENGDLVKPGAPISREHRVLLQLPQAFGGPDPEQVQSKWSINENAFNIVLQGGLTNPGVGPLVSVPVEWAAQRYADEPEIARVARIFNPYPPQSPMESLLPATLKRLSAYTYGKTGVDPSLGLGVGQREYNSAFAQNVQDSMVTFQLENGREPTAEEAADLVKTAGTETTTQMFHRVLWNSLSPAPAAPRSKYAVFQQGWYKIQEQARVEGKDFDWAYGQFKEKYGAAYLPLISSTANNPAWVDSSPADVAAIKHYKPLLEKVDPALSRMVIGAYAQDMIDADASLADYSVDARNFLRDEQIKPGDSTTYYSYDEPRAAMNEQMARRGWQKYGELTAGLTALAQQQGLNSYMESPALLAVKRAGIDHIRAENYAFDQDYGTFDTTQFDRLVDGMRTIAASPVFEGDASRSDIQVLKGYLALRDLFTQALDQRKEAGYGGPDAQAQAPMRQAYTALVGQLVASNTYFEEFAWNGTLERDPYLLTAESATVTGA